MFLAFCTFCKTFLSSLAYKQMLTIGRGYVCTVLVIPVIIIII